MVLITDYIAGITGGVAVVLVGHPFDTTKTRLQTAPVGHYKGKTWEGSSLIHSLTFIFHIHHEGTLDCVKTTFKNEGFKGFYAGLASPLYGWFPYPSFHAFIGFQLYPFFTIFTHIYTLIHTYTHLYTLIYTLLYSYNYTPIHYYTTTQDKCFSDLQVSPHFFMSPAIFKLNMYIPAYRR